MNHVYAKLDWFKTVILPHEATLRARLRRAVPKSTEHEDLVAQVLTRAYANANWRDVSHGRAYLFTIARNLVIDLARREKVVSFEAIADVEMLQSTHDLETQLLARDELRHLQCILETLPPQCRRVFVLSRIHEQSRSEIAAEMGLSVSTVEKHLVKAIRVFMRARAENGNARVEKASQRDQQRDRATGR